MEPAHGTRWSRSRMTADDLDASFLMWDIRRNLHVRSCLERVIIQFEFADAKKECGNGGLSSRRPGDLCLEDPGLRSIFLSAPTMNHDAGLDGRYLRSRRRAKRAASFGWPG
jgi:hypothetical protein